MTFFQVLGYYRVCFSIECMKKYPNYSLETIREEAGFKSYASFVRHFKRITGSTPSVFNADTNLQFKDHLNYV